MVIENPALATVQKISGTGLKIKAIGSLIIGIILIILGIVMSITTGSFQMMFLSIIGLAVIVGAWVLWRRAQRVQQGKFY